MEMDKDSNDIVLDEIIDPNEIEDIIGNIIC